MPDLLVIGDCSVDLYMLIDSPNTITDPETGKANMCFIHGSKIPVKSFRETLAGNSCHVGIGTQLLGLQTSIYTELGDDEQAQKFIDKFASEGINTEFCRKNENENTNIHSIIACDNERTIFSYHEHRTYSLPFDDMEKPKWIYYTSLAEGFEHFQKQLVDYLHTNPDIGVAFNPGTYQLKTGAENMKNLLDVTDVLFVNKQEAEKLSGSAPDSCSMEELHKKLAELGPKITVITDGGNGSSAYDGTDYIHMGPPEIEGKIVDKTGAGDSYAAAFLSALHYKKPIREAMEWGNKNAKNIVKQIGAIGAQLNLEQIQA